MKHEPISGPKLRGLLNLLLLVGLLAGTATSLLAFDLARAQESTPETVELGQFTFREMAIGQSVQYQIEAPVSTMYLVTTDDEEEAVAFDLIVIDADGEEVSSGIFETTELALDAGLYTLEFLAVDSAFLSFVVLGELGEMTSDAEQPGTLRSGSIYDEADVSDARYANLAIPATDYPQQVLLFIEAGVDDSFFLSAAGEELDAERINTDDTSLLGFWTNGGDYTITIEPVERRSRFTLIVFASGPPAALILNETADGVLANGTSQTVYELALDEALTELRIDLNAESAELAFSLVDELSDGRAVATGDSIQPVPLENVPEGVYYLFVESAVPATEDIPFQLTATGSSSPPLPSLENGVAASGTFAEGDAIASYKFQVDEPGARVRVTLQSDSDEVNHDLVVGLQPGQEIWRSYAVGAEDSVELVAPFAGPIFVDVLSNAGPGSFTVTAEETGPAPAVNINGVTWGTIGERDAAVYALPIDRPGQLLTIILVGAEGSDLQLGVTAYDNRGEMLAFDFDPGLASTALVGQPIDEAGLYEVNVSSLLGNGGDFFLVTRLEDPAALGGQWASAATASSERGTDDGAAQQATSAPDTTPGSDAATAWSATEADDGIQTIELTYEHAVVPQAVHIVQNLNPGAVVWVEGFDAAAGEWTPLWQGADTEAATTFSPELSNIGLKTNQLRITLDTASVPGDNQIDAVQLVGRP